MWSHRRTDWPLLVFGPDKMQNLKPAPPNAGNAEIARFSLNGAGKQGKLSFSEEIAKIKGAAMNLRHLFTARKETCRILHFSFNY
jgi:hypothetical protein